MALPVFRYQDAELKPDDVREFSTLPDGETVRVARHSEHEQRLMDALAQSGLQKIPGDALHTVYERGFFRSGLLTGWAVIARQFMTRFAA